jgi:hypothetical protein
LNTISITGTRWPPPEKKMSASGTSSPPWYKIHPIDTRYSPLEPDVRHATGCPPLGQDARIWNKVFAIGTARPLLEQDV